MEFTKSVSLSINFFFTIVPCMSYCSILKNYPQSHSSSTYNNLLSKHVIPNLNAGSSPCGGIDYFFGLFFNYFVVIYNELLFSVPIPKGSV